MAKRPVSNVDLFGEASSDADGSVSMTDDARDAKNTLISPAEYDRFAPTRVPRAQWFPGYRDRIPWSHLHVHWFSARRVVLT